MNGFNPRTRESATNMRTYILTKHDVSIHALVRVRLLDIRFIDDIAGFNPRTRESATCLSR